MPRFGPVSRADLARSLRALGFEGPISGTKHQIMIKGIVRIRLPNPHRRSSIGRALLSRILREAGIDVETWERL